MDKKYYVIAAAVALGAGYWWWSDKKKKEALAAASSPISLPSSQPPAGYGQPLPGAYPGPVPYPTPMPAASDPAALAALRRSVWEAAQTGNAPVPTYPATPAGAMSVMQMPSQYQYPR